MTLADRPLAIGLYAAPEVDIDFHGEFVGSDGSRIHGSYHFNAIEIDNPLRFEPKGPQESFTVKGMLIGIEFHWQQQRDLTFRGAIELRAEGCDIRVINIIDIEDYLKSVISSEMSGNASDSLLRAHAVISRSWVVSQMVNKARTGNAMTTIPTETADEVVRYWDRDSHTDFDVCADDHCQRYQGISHAYNPRVEQAIEDTRGLVLTDSNGHLVDARFSKCCGGATEMFSTCWADDDEANPCLQAFRDSDHPTDLPDLTQERTAKEWIEGRPDAYCSEATPEILSQVLNDYDLTTRDFYRWSYHWDAKKLGKNILDRTGLDVGTVLRLEPLKRGTSGRISSLRIVGTKRTVTIGKELMIRRALSPTHLYSSAFTVEYPEPGHILLKGAGWGHGVGLCQIGAAVMGAKGIDYHAILSHYFPNSNLTPLKK